MNSLLTLDGIIRAEDLFSQLKPERQERDRNLQVSENITLVELEKLFLKFEELYKVRDMDSFKLHEVIRVLAPNIELRNLNEFLALVTKYQGTQDFSERAGLFLNSLLSNHLKDDKVELRVGHLEERLSYLGAFNKLKEISIYGNVDYNIGYEMSGGSIVLQGNARDVGHFLKGGNIIVNGNVEHIGHHRTNGYIEINGNVDQVSSGNLADKSKVVINGNCKRITEFLNGGEIHINGSLGEINDKSYSGGQVYLNGVQIVKDGKLIGGRTK